MYKHNYLRLRLVLMLDYIRLDSIRFKVLLIRLTSDVQMHFVRGGEQIFTSDDTAMMAVKNSNVIAGKHVTTHAAQVTFRCAYARGGLYMCVGRKTITLWK